MSEVTRALVGSALPEGARVQLLGERELKDIDEPEIVYELTMPDVAVTPPPATPAGQGKRKRKVSEAEAQFDVRMDAWGARLEEAILRRVGRSFDRVGPGVPPGPEAADDGAAEVEGADAMASSFSGQLDAQLSALFAEIRSEERQGGVEPDLPT
jgi:hypothetical protein